MEYHVDLRRPDGGFTPDEVVARVRLGIAVELLALPDSWRARIPEAASWLAAPVVSDAGGRHLMAARLRDLSQGVIAESLRLRQPLRKPGRGAAIRLRGAIRRGGQVEAEPPRPTGSTSVILVELDPPPGANFDAYTAQHAPALRGMGALDAEWRTRSPWLVAREMSDNLSTDSEMAFYLLGTSELMVFNEGLTAAAEKDARRLRLKNPAHGVTYFYMHYAVLMEWVYLQEAILRTYLTRLDALAASRVPDRRRLIATLQGALADLVQYQEHITPYATRVEFLRRAHAYHELETLVERFENKQELLFDYVSEYHDYREARATEFLNWLAGILTGASLAGLIITLAGIQPEQTALYLGITLGSIILVLGIMAALLRRV
jgi:hypothetical protein